VGWWTKRGLRGCSITVLVALALAASGCSSTATIYRRDEPPLEARIVGGSPDSLLVAERPHQRTVVPRDSVTTIRHPGVIASTTGMVLFVGSLITPVFLWGTECVLDGQDRCVATSAIGTVGLAMLVWGAIKLSRSRRAERDTSLVLQPQLAPSTPFR
jgi:hypothetical protein